MLRRETDGGGFSSNGIPQILDELDFLGNGELFQIFNGRYHDSTDRMNASREQTFMRVVGKTRGQGSFYFKNQFSYFFVKNLLILKLKLVKYLKCEKVNTDP
jgi:hypothetical protein